MATTSWEIIKDRFTTTDMPELASNYFIQPYLPFIWYVNVDRLDTDSIPDLASNYFVYPYPPMIWYISNNTQTTIITPELMLVGAACTCYNVLSISIPKTIKNIASYSFRGTGISSVTIASDCTYYDNSFPPGCTVNFYPND